jgi:hypothetical protein
VRGPGWTIYVTGENATEVERVAGSLMEKTKDKEGRLLPRNPWITGSFYLASFVVIGALFLVMGRVVNMFALPVILVASILGISIVGAFQLRHDDRLQDKSFLELMRLTLSYLPILGKTERSQKKSTGAT